MNNPDLKARLVKYLRWRCKNEVDEEALELIIDLKYPTVICESGWHSEYLLRRFTPAHVEYLDSDGIWVRLQAGDQVISLILAGYMKRFYGPLQIKKYQTYQNVEYIVYCHDIHSK